MKKFQFGQTLLAGLLAAVPMMLTVSCGGDEANASMVNVEKGAATPMWTSEGEQPDSSDEDVSKVVGLGMKEAEATDSISD